MVFVVNKIALFHTNVGPILSPAGIITFSEYLFLVTVLTSKCAFIFSSQISRYES